MRFCSQPQRQLQIDDLPNDPSAIAKAQKLAQHTGLWLHDITQGAWYFNSVSTLGKAAYIKKVTEQRKVEWEQARATGNYNKGPIRRTPGVLAMDLKVRLINSLNLD